MTIFESIKMYFGLATNLNAFKPEKHIPVLDGKVILITGSNAGLGKEQLRWLATQGGSKLKLYMAARSRSKAEASIKELESTIPGSEIHFVQLDLSSLASVKAAAETFKQENDRLDVLVNNAGVMALPNSLTKDGYEIQFGTNFVGHYLLTRELLPLLEKTAINNDVRIVNLTSYGHNFATKGILFNELETDMSSTSTWLRYGQSKLSNILLTLELTRRYPSITSISIHPGVVNTNLADSFTENIGFIGRISKWLLSFVFMSPAQGALNQTWATVADIKGKKASGSGCEFQVVPGAYYSPIAVLGGETKWAKDGELAGKLWEWTEKSLKDKGY